MKNLAIVFINSKAIICAFFSFMLMIACDKNDFASGVEISPADTVTKARFDYAGVYFIKKETKDSNYLKRAAEMIPSIEIGKSDELYCGWYANKSTSSANGEGSGAYITISVSTDQGETWKSNELIIAPIDGLDRIFDMGLWKDPSGEVHAFWSRSIKSVWDGHGSVWECTIKYDPLGGVIKTSKPRLFMSTGVMLNKPIILDNTSKILYAQYIYNTKESRVLGLSGIYIYNGSTTYIKNELPLPEDKISVPFLPDTLRSAFFEPQLLQVDKDTVNCYIRTDNGGVYVSQASFKLDFKDWKPFTKLSALGINSPIRFCVRRLNSKNVLFVTCNHKDRVNMTAYISSDNGKTFPNKISLDKRWGVAYPDFTQDSNGNIFVVWDRGRTSIDREIVFTKIKEDDIINKNSVKLIKVNK